MLVADTGGDGFGTVQSGKSLSLGAFLDSANNDKILWKSNISNSGFGPGVVFENPLLTLDSTSLPNPTAGSWVTGNALALLWFPTLTTSTSTTTGGDAYGLFAGPASNGSSPWITPNNGVTNYQLYFLNAGSQTIDPGLSSPVASTGNASLVVAVGAAPEPSVSCLALLGAAGMVLRRRRSR